MSHRHINQKYKELRIKYFSDPNYATISNSAWNIHIISDLYEFNFLSLLLSDSWDGSTTDVCRRMKKIIQNYQNYPEINWPAYLNYIDEVREKLAMRHDLEIEIYNAVDEIRSKIGTPQNNQQIWI